MLSVPDLKASTLAIAPMQQVEMLQSQIEHMENQLSKVCIDHVFTPAFEKKKGSTGRLELVFDVDFESELV